jgi:hypothetical protein
LHPEDLLNEKLRKTGLSTCLQTLNSGYVSQTYAEFLLTDHDDIEVETEQH